MKRFTDTEKWSDAWFRKLPPRVKCFWSYLCDRCDNAGVWKPDFELASFVIGEEITAEILSVFDGRVEVLPSGNWFIKKFVHFQCGELNPECRPHRAIMTLLKDHQIGYQKGIDTLQDKKRKGKGQEQEEELSPEIEIYAFYPRKVGKPKALKAIKRAIEKFGPDAVLDATKRFADAWKGAEDLTFCPHPSTWFNQERFNDAPETWGPQRETTTTGATPAAVTYQLECAKKAKESQAAALKIRSCREGPLGDTWQNELDRESYRQLRREIKDLNARIAASV